MTPTLSCNSIRLTSSLTVQVAHESEEEFVDVIRQEMEGAVSVSVPLPVRVKKGPSWGQFELIH